MKHERFAWMMIGAVVAVASVLGTMEVMGRSRAPSVAVSSVVRPYWPTPPSALRRTVHTHVAVTGLVLHTRMEADSDRHTWVRDLVTLDSILGECIPRLPCAAPKPGTVVTLYGISRLDPEHGWPEVHPVEALGPR